MYILDPKFLIYLNLVVNRHLGVGSTLDVDDGRDAVGGVAHSSPSNSGDASGHKDVDAGEGGGPGGQARSRADVVNLEGLSGPYELRRASKREPRVGKTRKLGDVVERRSLGG